MKDRLKEFSQIAISFENIINNIRDIYNESYSKVGNLDKITQDYLHSLELDNLSYHERGKLANELQSVRQERRVHKDKVDSLTGIINQLDFGNNSKSLAFIINEIKRANNLYQNIDKRKYVKRGK